MNNQNKLIMYAGVALIIASGYKFYDWLQNKETLPLLLYFGAFVIGKTILTHFSPAKDNQNLHAMKSFQAAIALVSGVLVAYYKDTSTTHAIAIAVGLLIALIILINKEFK